MTEQPVKFETWALLELYGHARLAGLVSEQTIGGVGFIRVDVPEVQRQAVRWAEGGKRETFVETIAGFTKFYGPGALFSITPTTEEIARAVACSIASRPIQQFELPQLKALEAPPEDDEEGDPDDEDDGEDTF